MSSLESFSSYYITSNFCDFEIRCNILLVWLSFVSFGKIGRYWKSNTLLCWNETHKKRANTCSTTTSYHHQEIRHRPFFHCSSYFKTNMERSECWLSGWKCDRVHFLRLTILLNGSLTRTPNDQWWLNQVCLYEINWILSLLSHEQDHFTTQRLKLRAIARSLVDKVVYVLFNNVPSFSSVKICKSNS